MVAVSGLLVLGGCANGFVRVKNPLKDQASELQGLMASRQADRKAKKLARENGEDVYDAEGGSAADDASPYYYGPDESPRPRYFGQSPPVDSPGAKPAFGARKKPEAAGADPMTSAAVTLPQENETGASREAAPVSAPQTASAPSSPPLAPPVNAGKVCYRCNGKGYVLRMDNDFSGEQVPCTDCGGTGRVR